MAVDASDFLGTPQLDGVRVNPFGSMRRVEKRTLITSGGIPVSGNLAERGPDSQRLASWTRRISRASAGLAYAPSPSSSSITRRTISGGLF
jgi:hypothetical protein